MKILTLESSSVSASVCVTEDTRLLAQSFQNCGMTHSATLLPMIDQVMTAPRLTMDDSYAEDALRMEIWLNGDDLPVRGEIYYGGRRILSLDVKNFVLS